MRKEINCLVKVAGYSSTGITVLRVIEEGEKEQKYLVINHNRCKKISGVDEYLSCYLGNTVRVFTPAKIGISGMNFVSVQLTSEKVEFVCELVKELPDFLEEKLPVIGGVSE